jgi:hypothetical protein
VQIGDFTVVPVLPNGRRFTGRSVAAIDVTRGMTFSGVDFALAATASGRPSTSVPDQRQFDGTRQTGDRGQLSITSSLLSGADGDVARAADHVLL